MNVELLDDRALGPLLPVRDADAHKGTHGTLLAICGSLEYAGAALLTALAAARAGAGLVCLAVPASIQALVAGRVPEAITMGLPESADGLDHPAGLERVAGRAHDALVVGPGLIGGPGTAALLRGLLRSDGAPVLLDAQALNELSAETAWWDDAVRARVMTPHAGEFARLEGVTVGDGDEERAERAVAAAARWGSVVVLKGARTIVAAPDGAVSRAPFANPALATAGTGDVLAGTIGALLAQGIVPYDAARLGVFLHGTAAAAISERMGEAGLLASDLPAAIALARRDLAAVRDRQRGDRRLGFAHRDARS